MTPTLYADDLDRLCLYEQEQLRNLACVLPRRCDNCWGNQNDCMDCVLRHSHDKCDSPCPICDGRGWLYPDPPDWLNEYRPEVDFTWEDFCDLLWRALGIVEDNDE